MWIENQITIQENQNILDELKNKIMKPKNLKEFKALIKCYESITLEEIKKESKYLDFIDSDMANELTGFGNSDDCSLCKVIDWGNNCDECIYYILTRSSCNCGINFKTYRGIADAKTPLELLNAFRARAKHMQTLLNSKS